MTEPELTSTNHLATGWQIAISAAVAAVATAIVVGFIAWVVVERNDWRPLGPFPVQIIVDADHVIDVSRESIRIDATKCRHGTDGVQVQGQRVWRRVAPPGFQSDLIVGGTRRCGAEWVCCQLVRERHSAGGCRPCLRERPVRLGHRWCRNPDR